MPYRPPAGMDPGRRSLDPHCPVRVTSGNRSKAKQVSCQSCCQVPPERPESSSRSRPRFSSAIRQCLRPTITRAVMATSWRRVPQITIDRESGRGCIMVVNVSTGRVLPVCVNCPDTLPPWPPLPHHQPQLITRIQKRLILRVMRNIVSDCCR